MFVSVSLRAMPADGTRKRGYRVSTGQQGQVTQQAGEATAASRVREFFKLVAATSSQPRLRYVNGVCRFDIDGAGSWRVAVKDGTMTVSEAENDTSPVDVVISTTADVISRILTRENNLNVFAAGLQGAVDVSGDLVFGWALVQGMTFSQLAPGRR